MPGEWKRNTVHKIVLDHAHGISPIRWREGCAALVVGIVLLVPLGGVLAIGAAVAVALGLFLWRMAEHNRPEYAFILWRRLRRGQRCYNALEADPTAFWRDREL